MATFNYTVDTHPMADELSSMSRHVNATTGAVVAMQTAVILAEEKAADHVCANVNKGFYSLIRSQISQKMAKYQSDVDSNLMQLNQQKIALVAIKQRMERDYNLICSRYIKLFNGLNSNLRLRVYELDRPAMDLAIKENEKSSNRVKNLAATITIGQLESVSLGQNILGSNVKLRGLRVLNSMKTFLSGMVLQKKRTEEILIKQPGIQDRIFYLPAVLIETKASQQGESLAEIFISSTGLTQFQRNQIKNQLIGQLYNLNWQPAYSKHPEVDKYFRNLCAESNLSDRVKKMTLNLYESSSISTL
jgi:hypothetical protein